MPLQSKIGGLRRVAVGILKSGKAALVSSPISNRDITAGDYARPGSNMLPENSGYVATGGDALQGYISNRTLKERNSLFSSSALFM